MQQNWYDSASSYKYSLAIFLQFKKRPIHLNFSFKQEPLFWQRQTHSYDCREVIILVWKI